MTKKVGALLDEYPGPTAHDATGAPASASRTIALTSSEKSLRPEARPEPMRHGGEAEFLDQFRERRVGEWLPAQTAEY